MKSDLETVHGVVDKPPAGRLDFIFYWSEYEGWFKVYLKPRHLVMYPELFEQETHLQLAVYVNREKAEMYLCSAQLDTTPQATENL